MKTIRMSGAGLFAVLMLMLSVPTAPAHAEFITNSDLNEQKRVVMVNMVDVLRENVKLLQMIYIRRLEAQVSYLQAHIDNQS